MRRFLPVFLLIVACNDDIVQPDALVGSWGGVDAGLVVTASEATLSLTCGAGTLNSPIQLDPEGRFVTMGETWFLGGAPPRPGEEPIHTAVRFSGRVDADRLTLTLLYLAPNYDPSGSNTRTFRLVRNAEPRVLLCP